MTALPGSHDGDVGLPDYVQLVEEFELRRSPVGLPRSLDVAADLAELPESLMMRFEQQGSRGGMGHQIGV